jgi:hypothetical protein
MIYPFKYQSNHQQAEAILPPEPFQQFCSLTPFWEACFALSVETLFAKVQTKQLKWLGFSQ